MTYSNMVIDDVRIARMKPLIPPAILLEELPATDEMAANVTRHRNEIQDILHGRDDRLLVVVGPCSIHDPDAAREYAARLKPLADRIKDKVKVVMRVYFEKPRTIVGWKGLINDPFLDDSFQINKGLHIARDLLRDMAAMDMPTGVEFLDSITPQFIADLVSWGAIGARTTESQVHRELASGLSATIGFKNGTDGQVGIAIDAIRAASHGHQFLSVTKQGVSAIVETRGNPDCHLILRGATSGPNYDAAHVGAACDALEQAGLRPTVMVDASHGNSMKDHRNQALVLDSVIQQRRADASRIFGVMIESHLVAGRQDCKDPSNLVYGQSITDACIGWEETVKVLEDLHRG
ncbi:3-deoxy-7-phosphoheptulonate synthase [Litorivicinus lipolyticus]|uniref:3-deoxy-7-phosphoheptulonate synthase n=1 Tax=Litorivicinus lipolyticus TaxID=418701 RepID=UPI003B5CD0B0